MRTDVLGSRLWRLRQCGYKYTVTVRCQLACGYCEHCRRGAAGESGESAMSPAMSSAMSPAMSPAMSMDRAPEGTSGDDQRVVRLVGGDPLRYGDLRGWVAWSRGNPLAWVEVEGPAASLAGEDAQEVVARIVDARPDGVTLVLPSVDAARTLALTGLSWEPARALDAMAVLSERGVAVTVAVAINAETVSGLRDVVVACAERLGAGVDIVLRRTPTIQRVPARLSVLGVGARWDELDELSHQIARLPAALPGGARLHMDAQSGYAPCMLRPEARRVDLTPAAAQGGGAPQSAFGPACAGCSWRLRCTWLAPALPLPAAQIVPLRDDEALGLQEHATDVGASHRPHAASVKRDRADLGVPDFLCVAPWVSMSTTEWNLSPVPCALSWVDTAVATEAAATALGIPVAEMQGFERRASRKLSGVFHCLDNALLSLPDLWNSPLLRIMRHQMLGGCKSDHCRTMCRTVMGVEDRGADLLARPDSELTPSIAANRRLLVEEMRERRVVLTAHPLELVMGVAAHCNITCGFCTGPGGRTGELTDRRRDEIIAWLPSLMGLTVSGPGEPLMSRNYLALLSHIADADYPGLSVALTTNGTLLTPEFLKRHRRLRWSHVRISLNAGSARTHERMTGKKLFERVIENLDALCALREAQSPPFQVTLSCVLSEMVMGDLHAFAELVTRYRAHVVVEPMYGDMDGLSPWTRPERLALLAEELRAVADAFMLKNPPLSQAFRAVDGFARERLAGGSFATLAHH